MRRLVVLLALCMLGLVPVQAHAAFPGANGKLAYDSGVDGDVEIYTVNPDGTGKTQLTNNSGYDARPVWSPDGSKIAFACCSEGAAELWVMSATGANPVQLTEDAGVVDSAAWSPDGSRIVYSRSYCPCPVFPDHEELWTVNADGTGDAEILEARLALHPSWSPDGMKIAFARAVGGGASTIGPMSIATVKPDGSDLALLTECDDHQGPDWSPNAARIVFNYGGTLVTMNADGSGQSSGCPGIAPAGESPVWSPDGTKIAFLHRPSGDAWEIHTVNPDLTGEQEVTEIAPPLVSPGPPRGLDWQPIPINSYVRPAGARVVNASLVPAFRICDPDQASASHGPPLAYPSCAAPKLTTGYLTIGTPDVNDHEVAARGHVSIGLGQYGDPPPIDPNNGDQADVQYSLRLRDVLWASDFSDYTGELEIRVALRMTDRNNAPSPFPTGAATSVDGELSFTIPCTPTTSSEGGECRGITTADALAPGAVKEAQRSVWELGKVRVFDGGADGDAQTGPNTLFATQGVFVP
jgi:hypothetical protein